MIEPIKPRLQLQFITYTDNNSRERIKQHPKNKVKQNIKSVKKQNSIKFDLRFPFQPKCSALINVEKWKDSQVQRFSNIKLFQTLYKSLLRKINSSPSIYISHKKYTNPFLNIIEFPIHNTHLLTRTCKNVQKMQFIDRNWCELSATYLSLKLPRSLKSLVLEISPMISNSSPNCVLFQKGIQRAKNLEEIELRLDKCSINVCDFYHLFSSINTLKKLNSIKYSLKHSKLDEEKLKILVKQHNELGLVRKLHLNFEGNQINSSSAQVISELISNFSISLEDLQLNLSSNPLQFSGINQILIGISLLKNQQNLNLNFFNSIKVNQNIKCFGKDIQQLKKLESLILNFGLYNLDSSNLFESIGNILKNSNNLKNLELSLDNCKITNRDLTKIGVCLETSSKKLERLKLNLFKNQISHSGIQFFVNHLQKLSNLRELKLYLQKNDLTTQGFETLLFKLSKCSSLEILRLNLFNNSISQLNYTDLRDFINSLVNLKEIYIGLGRNELSTTKLGVLWFCIDIEKPDISFIFDLYGTQMTQDFIQRCRKIEQEDNRFKFLLDEVKGKQQYEALQRKLYF